MRYGVFGAAAILCAAVFGRSLVAAPSLGRIEGTVKFPGETPRPFLIVNRDERQCPHGIAPNRLLVDQTTLGLQNAVVALDADELRRPMPLAAFVVTGCVFQPRVQAITAGTNVEFSNADATGHRLHIYRDGVSTFEIPLPQNGAAVRRPFVDKGLFQVNCDRHLWERGWIYVSDHPYIAVTGAHGEFAIEHIPPGRYGIRAWHEGWLSEKIDRQGRTEFQPMAQRQEITIHSGKTTHVTFDQMAPDRAPTHQ